MTEGKDEEEKEERGKNSWNAAALAKHALR